MNERPEIPANIDHADYFDRLLKDRVNKLLAKFDPDKKRQEIRLIEVESLKPNFWQDHQNAALPA